MAVPAPTSALYLQPIHTNHRTLRHYRSFPTPSNKPFTVFAMAPKNKVNKYNDNWKKQWFGAGIFYEGSEEVEVDVFKKLEKRKVLSNVEKAGLLSKAEEFGVTLSSIEKLGLFSKAEELGLLSLLEKLAAVSPSVLASLALPTLLAAVATVVLVPADSTALVVVQAVVAAALGVGAVGLFAGSVVLGGLQEAD
uniref:Transmembrane protein n=1 Tax=Medicago truncatula TaxID=3880 RepID=B7FFF0_MEDTR|nr:unknown [Medicago truncatula]